ncbi:MAG TPA: UdgX family uracil-DNA binding protein [Acidimicrobiia bacterium]
MSSPTELNLDLLTLSEAAEAAKSCTGCELYKDATQVVFGEGPPSASLMLVGEQPGDREDEAGEPFVGPAGRELDRALEIAGIDRSEVYVTNVVKHFRFEERGKKRLHKKPTRGQIAACRPWFEAELAKVDPGVIVCLGGSAAQALLGSGIRVMKDHGVPREWEGFLVVPTIHPSFVLRSSDDARRSELFALLVDDLRMAVELASAD